VVAEQVGDGVRQRISAAESVPSMIGDADPPGVRAAWSPGAVPGQRGSDGSGWPPRRRDPVSGVVPVVAVVLLRAGRVLTRLGAALCPSDCSLGPRSVLQLPSRVYACLGPPSKTMSFMMASQFS
jgi:hypothetical protein